LPPPRRSRRDRGDDHGRGHEGARTALDRIGHIVVIYDENHSFDNLYGGWEGVEGTAAADAAHTTQVGQDGAAYACLLQNDLNLVAPPQPATCTDKAFSSAFPNRPFTIDELIAPTDTTCPAPGVFAPNGVLKGQGEPGGCTCDSPHPAGVACGDFAVNTIQPPFQPFGGGTQLPAQSAPTIGDRLSDRGVDWAWYSGGWSNANGDIGAPG
jgi:phospholipase C